MTAFCIQNLIDIDILLSRLNHEQYCYKAQFLYGASMGEHLRHILEFYQKIVNIGSSEVVNYDQRQRNKAIENDILVARNVLNCLIECLKNGLDDRDIALECHSLHEPFGMSTSLKRELFYCLEHSIHHQALIKVSLKEQHLEHLIEPNFGLAYSTIQYKQQLCVQ